MQKYTSIKECLKEESDVGFVTNVSSEHIGTAKILANANCHLFIEKSLSNSLISVSNLLTITKKKQLITQMGCNFRFHDCIKKIKQILLNNELGRMISARVEWDTYLPEWHPYEDHRTSYASRKDLGGGVVLTCIHKIDYLYWFFADVKVVAMTGTYSDLGIDVDDLAVIIMKFKNNVIAELHLDYFQRPDFRSCKIVGTKGTLYWDSETNEVRVYDIKSKKWITKL